MLNVSRLNVFREVIERGSFSDAADALSYSQSAVSQAIATLEARNGRAADRAQPRRRAPDGGRRRAGRARRRHPGADGDGRGRDRGDRGRPRRPSADRLVPDRRGDADAAGDRRLPRLPPGRRGEPGRGRAGGDRAAPAGRRVRPRPALRVRGRRRAGSSAGLRRFDLLEDPLHLALPTEHPLAKRRKAPRLADLRDESWVQTSATSPCARHVVRSCHAAGFEPRVSFESDDYADRAGAGRGRASASA